MKVAHKIILATIKWLHNKQGKLRINEICVICMNEIDSYAFSEKVQSIS